MLGFPVVRIYLQIVGAEHQSDVTRVALEHWFNSYTDSSVRNMLLKCASSSNYNGDKIQSIANPSYADAPDTP